jgi:hypothetical protein
MNKADYNYLKEKIKHAEESKALYDMLGSNYDKESQFWRGSLNALNLMWLQAKHDYKLV